MSLVTMPTRFVVEQKILSKHRYHMFVHYHIGSASHIPVVGMATKLVEQYSGCLYYCSGKWELCITCNTIMSVCHSTGDVHGSIVTYVDV